MELLQLIAAEQNVLFTLCLVLMMLIFALEVVSSGAASTLLESILPDFDADVDIEVEADMEVDVDVETPDSPFLGKIIGWMWIKHIPVMMVFVAFMAIFSIIGLSSQFFIRRIFGAYLPGWIIVGPVFVATIPLLRGVVWLLGSYVIKEESTAVKEASFVSRVGYITT
ncbi:unnamed protein product, partial [marine sediment metagenome]